MKALYSFMPYVFSMNLFYLSLGFGVLLLLLVLSLSVFSPPNFLAIPLANDSTIHAGEGEACITPYAEIECEEGLECTLISDKPQKNGKCLKPGTTLDDTDYVNRDGRTEINT